MATVQHHAILVSSPSEHYAYAAHHKAQNTFKAISGFGSHGCMVSAVLASPVNNWFTFLVGPDGSKDGWSESNSGDACRHEFISWLRENEYYFYWVELLYCDKSTPPSIVDHSYKMGHSNDQLSEICEESQRQSPQQLPGNSIEHERSTI